MIPQQPLNKKNRLTELDALRGLAALSVVFFHYREMPGYNLSFLSVGVTGVDLFFLISGYVIFMTLEKVSTAKEFIVSRLSRIYPSYLVMIVITSVFVVVFSGGVMPSSKDLLGNVTMLQPFFKTLYIDDVYWTLVVEIQFYAFMLLIYLLGRIKQVIPIGLVFVFLVLVFHLVAGTYFPDSKIYIVPRSLFPFICHFQLFLAGIVFYKIRTQGATWYSHIFILFCFLSSIFLFSSSGKSHYFIDLGQYIAMLLIYFCVFYLFVFKKLQFISIKPLIFLGAISYCLYLVHGKAGNALYYYAIKHYTINLPLLTVLIICLMMGLAAIITYVIEKPTISFIREKLRTQSVAKVSKESLPKNV